MEAEDHETRRVRLAVEDMTVLRAAGRVAALTAALAGFLVLGPHSPGWARSTPAPRVVLQSSCVVRPGAFSILGSNFDSSAWVDFGFVLVSKTAHGTSTISWSPTGGGNPVEVLPDADGNFVRTFRVYDRGPVKLGLGTLLVYTWGLNPQTGSYDMVGTLQVHVARSCPRQVPLSIQVYQQHPIRSNPTLTAVSVLVQSHAGAHVRLQVSIGGAQRPTLTGVANHDGYVSKSFWAQSTSDLIVIAQASFGRLHALRFSLVPAAQSSRQG